VCIGEGRGSRAMTGAGEAGSQRALIHLCHNRKLIFAILNNKIFGLLVEGYVVRDELNCFIWMLAEFFGRKEAVGLVKFKVDR
jgi:hypothetical protein